MAVQSVNLSNTVDDWRRNFNNVATWQGDLDVLETSVTSDLVLAINSLLTDVNALDSRPSCRVGTTDNLSTIYDASALTLTNSGTKAALEIDSIILEVDDRILVKDQTDGTQNGIYTVTDTGSSNSSWILTRATDLDTSSEITAGIFLFITEGTINSDDGYLLTTDDDITLDTTSLTFSSFTTTGMSVSDTSGLDLTGSNLSINVDDSTIEIDTTNNWLQVKDEGITKNKINDDVAGNGLTQNTDGSLIHDVGKYLYFDLEKRLAVDPSTLDGNGLVSHSNYLHVLVDNNTLEFNTIGDVLDYGDVFPTEIRIKNGGVKSIKLDDNIDIVEDFTVGGNLLYIDNSKNQIGINTSSPENVPTDAGSILDIRGAVEVWAGLDDDEVLPLMANPLFRIRGKDPSDTHSLLYIDGENDRVCIGTQSPGDDTDERPNRREKLTVNGAISIGNPDADSGRGTTISSVAMANEFGKLFQADRPMFTMMTQLPQPEQLTELESEGDLHWRYKDDIQGGNAINISRAVPKAFLNLSWRAHDHLAPWKRKYRKKQTTDFYEVDPDGLPTTELSHGIETIAEVALPHPGEEGYPGKWNKANFARQGYPDSDKTYLEPGVVKVTFTKPFADTNYLVMGVAYPDAFLPQWPAPTTSSRQGGGGLVVQAINKTTTSCELWSIGHGGHGLAASIHASSWGEPQWRWEMDNISVVFYGDLGVG